jgi:CMP-N,N'-diacetyllegionaminic acid synthase
MTTIATICARGGSAGLPRKNVKPLLGKPLIVHTIEQAQACRAVERIFVSTDDAEIAEIARRAGAEVPFLRPAELATSSAPKIPVIEHLVDHVGKLGVAIDRIIDLDPTSPLRNLADIEACLSLLDWETDVVITAYPAEKNPYFNMVEEKPDGHIGLVKTVPGGVTSRQLAPAVYAMNASIYIWRLEALKHGIWGNRIKLHVMPRERSIDIDTPIDFMLVEALMKKKAALLDAE